MDGVESESVLAGEFFFALIKVAEIAFSYSQHDDIFRVREKRVHLLSRF